jgi:hypothetical protein
MLRRNQPELVAARARDELRELKLEPGAATFAPHLVQVLRSDRTPLLFMDFYAAFGCTMRWHDVQIYSSAELRRVARMGGAFLHGRFAPSNAIVTEMAAASLKGEGPRLH